MPKEVKRFRFAIPRTLISSECVSLEKVICHFSRISNFSYRSSRDARIEGGGGGWGEGDFVIKHIKRLSSDF